MRRELTRREVLSGLAAGGAASLAGCSGAPGSGGTGGDGGAADAGTNAGTGARTGSETGPRTGTETEQTVTGTPRPPLPGEWPTFGYDAGNTGVAPDASGPDRPGERWRVDLDGSINATPAVSDGTVYATTLSGTVYALNARTGERAWTIGGPFPQFGTPAVDGDTLFVADGGGTVYALADELYPEDSVGQVRWTADGDAGFTASLTVVDGRVYAGTFEGGLHAFDAGDGSRLWAEILGDNVDVAPAVADGLVYVTVPRGVVFALEATTGEERWQTGTGTALTTAPAVRDGLAYVASSDTQTYGDETRVVALDAADGSVVWKAPIDGGTGGSVALTGDLVVAGTWHGTVHGFDQATGEERWHTTVDDGITGAPAVAGGTAYVSGISDGVHAVDLADGTHLWSAPIGSGIPEGPAVAGDAVYVGTDGSRLHAIGT